MAHNLTPISVFRVYEAIRPMDRATALAMDSGGLHVRGGGRLSPVLPDNAAGAVPPFEAAV
jgi:hypothetical protein